MRKFGLIAMLMVFAVMSMGMFGGCEKAEGYKQKGDDIAGKVVITANGVTFAIDAADPIISKLEEATGINLNPEIAEKYGADGYAKSAGTAVDEAINLLKMLQKEESGA